MPPANWLRRLRTILEAEGEPAVEESRLLNPRDEDLAENYAGLARALGTNLSKAFAFYHLVKGGSGSRITLEEMVGLVSSLPEDERTVEAVIEKLEAIESAPRTGQLPGSRIEWRELPPASGGSAPAAVSGRTARPKKPAAVKKALPVEDRIEWEAGQSGDQPDPEKLIGVEDAFEHTPLLPGERVAYCTYDRVAYHLSTWEFLRAENGGRCCSCGRAGTMLFLRLPGELVEAQPAVPAAVDWSGLTGKIIGLKEVYNYIGQAVVVQDRVQEVYQTKSTGTCFVRFEKRKPGDRPFDGFKVVIFPRYQAAWVKQGISPMSYAGQFVRVRGVIQLHPEWGIEILINSPRVIQVVDEPEGEG